MSSFKIVQICHIFNSNKYFFNLILSENNVNGLLFRFSKHLFLLLRHKYKRWSNPLILWYFFYQMTYCVISIIFSITSIFLPIKYFSIWTISVRDHPGTIPVEFDQIPISGSREEVICSFPYIIQWKIVTPGAGSILTPGA